MRRLFFISKNRLKDILPQILEMEAMPEKKRCSGCAKMRLVEMFEDGRKMREMCRGKKKTKAKQLRIHNRTELERQIKTIKTKKKQERADKDFAEQ